jgi:hypothetical protein
LAGRKGLALAYLDLLAVEIPTMIGDGFLASQHAREFATSDRAFRYG